MPVREVTICECNICITSVLFWKGGLMAPWSNVSRVGWRVCACWVGQRLKKQQQRKKMNQISNSNMTEVRMKVQELHSGNGQIYELIVTGMRGFSCIFVYWYLRYLALMLKVDALYNVSRFRHINHEIRRIFFVICFRKLSRLDIEWRKPWRILTSTTGNLIMLRTRYLSYISQYCCHYINLTGKK
jgi:hypothetical protein